MDDIEGPEPDQTWAAKLALRDQLLTARGRQSLAGIAERARSLARSLLAEPEVRRAATIAAYVSIGHEPGTGPLLDALLTAGKLTAGKRVILPLLLPDNDLDWATYEGPDSLVAGRRGMLEPAGFPLGTQAIATADLVLTPGLAVDRRGHRLGRGGGSYDRALTRATGAVWCLVNADEVLDDIPHAHHDQRIDAAVTENGVIRIEGRRIRLG